MRELIIQPQLGLCNRLRAAITGTMLGEKYGRQVYLVWKVEPTCGARWSDLFTNPVQEKDRLPDEPPAFDGTDVEALSHAVQSDQPVVCVATPAWLREGNDWNIMLAKFRALQPVPVVQQKIDALLAQFTAPTMGVHVRRADFLTHLPKKHDAKLPPLERYFEHLDAWEGRYFLATDDGQEVEDAFRRRYGERLIIYPKRSRERGEVEAVQDAVVDLFVLQRCQSLVGTHHSSFSHLASIYGMPRIRLEERDDESVVEHKTRAGVSITRKALAG